MVWDQTREIRRRSPWMARGAAPAALRAALMAERKQDSSPAEEAEAGTNPCSATAPTAPAISRLRTAPGCFNGTSFGGLAASVRGQEVHDFASPGHPGFAFVVRPWFRAFVVLHPVHRQCVPWPAWPGDVKTTAAGGASLGDLLRLPPAFRPAFPRFFRTQVTHTGQAGQGIRSDEGNVRKRSKTTAVFTGW